LIRRVALVGTSGAGRTATGTAAAGCAAASSSATGASSSGASAGAATGTAAAGTLRHRKGAAAGKEGRSQNRRERFHRIFSWGVKRIMRCLKPTSFADLRSE
jgi:ABC-type glutathione transport system ATPase component